MMYGYGVFIAAFLIGGTVLLAIGLNRPQRTRNFPSRTARCGPSATALRDPAP